MHQCLGIRTGRRELLGAGTFGGSMLDKIGTTDDSCFEHHGSFVPQINLFQQATVEFLSGLKPEPIILEHPVIFKVLRLSLALIRV